MLHLYVTEDFPEDLNHITFIINTKSWTILTKHVHQWPTSFESRVNRSPPRRNSKIKYSFPSVWKAATSSICMHAFITLCSCHLTRLNTWSISNFSILINIILLILYFHHHHIIISPSSYVSATSARNSNSRESSLHTRHKTHSLINHSLQSTLSTSSPFTGPCMHAHPGNVV